MPIRRCTEDGKPGYKCGNQGKCYTYNSGDEAGRKSAKKKAIDQCLAMGEPPGKASQQELDSYIEKKLP